MTSLVYLDTGIFIAFLNRRDRWHPHAVALFGGKKTHWRTSFLVISEAYSWFLHKMGEEAARSFRSLVENLPGLRIFDATAEHHESVVKMLNRFRGAKLTYVDASSLHLVERHKIESVWSTDHHLGLTGAEIFPRS
jgi:predicted nucleic acid-binding protein